MITQHKDSQYFKIDLPVRISDINYGKHLGHAELIKITHHARLKMFSEYSLDELDIDGAGVIVKELSVTYKGEAFFDDVLTIYLRLKDVGRASCIFEYDISKNENANVAHIMERIAFVNYKNRKLVRTPQKISTLLDVFL